MGEPNDQYPQLGPCPPQSHSQVHRPGVRVAPHHPPPPLPPSYLPGCLGTNGFEGLDIKGTRTSAFLYLKNSDILEQNLSAGC